MTDQLTSRLAAGALVVAPILLLAATVLFTTVEGGMNEGQIGGAILVWAMIAFAVGLLGLVRRLEASAPRGAGVLVLVGCAGLIGRWSAVLIVVGALLFPASRVPNIAALAILADLVLVAGLAPVGAAQLARRQRGVAGGSASAAV